ncbi:hypothetical protein LTR37_015262 [Vermiconidia calcicola]|uniref:Uncharacterized protein n=1 Tax=Vermiconidia calcicola TaxID=1690605 RepID=A0ACC3MRD4_9PEZI|nr:hypothetical protein LTR37_015262 [Vermiconidia calcicola]
MALSGACPGTVFVQLAQGISSANSTALGALLGGGTYVRLLHLIKKQPPQKGTKAAALSKQTISDELEISEVVTYVILGAAVMAILCLTEAGAGSFPTSPTAGGLLIGLAQAASLLLTSDPLGVSTVYEQTSRYTLRALDNERVGKLSWPPNAIISALGVVAGSTALLKQGTFPDVSAKGLHIPAWQAFVGGFVMAFGARLGRGCTSGHGLSGLSAMSFSSLITMTAMFGARIVTRLSMKALNVQ